MRSRRIHPLCAALLLASSAACSDQLTEPAGATGPSFAILDGAHAGTAHFFFLPPMVPSPSYGGTFDGTQSPVVTICVLSGSTCGATVATFSGSQIQVQVADQAYKVIWKTKGAGLNSDNVYRILVTVGGTVLGYADALVLNSGSTVKIVDQGQTVATVTGGSLPIRFRIETPPPSTGVWKNNDYITYTQADWGDANTTGGALLAARFDAIYGTFPLSVGSPFPTGHALIFTSSNSVLNFLPQSGQPGPILGRFTDPTTTNAGVFGGEAVAFMLNAQFSSAGHTPAPGGVAFGDLVLCGFPAQSPWNGLVIRDFLITATRLALVNGFAPYLTIDEVQQMAALLNASFSNGVPSQFAQDHLISGPCAGAWNPGDLTSYPQNTWGATGSPAQTVLANRFDAFYGGGVEIGIPANAGYSIILTSAFAVMNYLPDCGPSASLHKDHVDPRSTEASCLGGATVALQLDVDFSDAGFLPAASGLRFGDLRICGVNDVAAVEGETVRALLARATQFLGGAVPDTSGGIYPDALAFLIEDVTGGFDLGMPSTFARRHLVNGPCS